MVTGVEHYGGVRHWGCPQSPASVCWLTHRAFSTSLVFFIQWLGEDFQVRKHLWVLAVLGKPLHCMEPACPFAAFWPLSGLHIPSPLLRIPSDSPWMRFCRNSFCNCWGGWSWLEESKEGCGLLYISRPTQSQLGDKNQKPNDHFWPAVISFMFQEDCGWSP